MSFFYRKPAKDHICYSERYQEHFPVSVLAKYIVPRNEELKKETRRKSHVQANTEIPKIPLGSKKSLNLYCKKTLHIEVKKASE